MRNNKKGDFNMNAKMLCFVGTITVSTITLIDAIRDKIVINRSIKELKKIQEKLENKRKGIEIKEYEVYEK